MSGSHRTGRRQLRRACLETGHIWWPKDRQWERCETCGALRPTTAEVTPTTFQASEATTATETTEAPTP